MLGLGAHTSSQSCRSVQPSALTSSLDDDDDDDNGDDGSDDDDDDDYCYVQATSSQITWDRGASVGHRTTCRMSRAF